MTGSLCCTAGIGCKSTILKFIYLLFYYLFIFFAFFLGPNLRHTQVPRLGVKWELKPPAYTTATATQDPSCICDDIHHRSQHCRILNPLSEARDQTRNLMVPSRIRFHCAMTGTPGAHVLNRVVREGHPEKVTFKAATHVETGEDDGPVQRP